MNHRVLVIGEYAIDRFIYGRCPRLAPDGPFPVFIQEDVVENDGCAANVARNLESLAPGSEVDFFSNPRPIIKTRFVDKTSNYTLIRWDQNDNVNPISITELAELLCEINIYDAVVISDYHKGFLEYGVINDILNRCHELQIPTFLDTKKLLDNWSRHAFVVKINEPEFNAQFKQGYYVKAYENLIVTLGDRGAKYNNEIYPANIIEVRDLSGAGDTFLAGLVVNYLETNDLGSAIRFANKAAAVAVSKRGVVAVKREEVV